MGIKFHPGFTIIETMLFLAITGVLIVSILAGSGTAINNQRYQDSVTSLKAIIQDQYAQATSVNNTQSIDSITCDTNGLVTVDSSQAAVPRGQGGCVIIGRFMLINDSTITTSSVVGYNKNDSSYYVNLNASDITELKDYTLSLLSTTTTSDAVQWGSRIAWPSRGSYVRTPSVPRTVGILILRSPKSGLTYTFTADAPSPSALSAMIVAGTSIPGQGENRICVSPNGVIVVGGLAVVIDTHASGPSGVEVRSNDMGDAAAC
jgi:type II secretory pathway pseudopilin PulG